MRLLYVVPGYKPAYKHGGPIVAVAATAERLASSGHEVTVFTTNSNVDEDLDIATDCPLDVDGVEVWYFRRDEFLKRWFGSLPYLSGSAGFCYAPKMAAALNDKVPKMDIVYAQMPFVYPTYAAAKAALRHNVPFIYKGFGSLDPQRIKFRSFKKRLYINAIESKLMRDAAMLIALTQAEFNSYQALGITTRCRIVPDGIDASDYRQKPLGALPSEWGISAEAQVILYLGRLWIMKGPHKLIEAFAQVHHRFPNAVLVVAGPNEHGIETQLRALAIEKGVAKKVVFPGMVTGETKLDLLARADVFSLPSEAEGFSIAVLEALASGTPVLISPGCYFPEVEAAGAGRVVAAESSKLADALASMLDCPEKLCAMGEAGRALVTEKYSWEPITEQLLDVYAEVLERNNVSGEAYGVNGRCV